MGLNCLQYYELIQVICVITHLDIILDSLDPFRNCGRHIETAIHFFLHCLNYWNQRKYIFGKISTIKRSLVNQNDSIIVETRLFRLNYLNVKENAWTIESTIEYIITMERFIIPLFWIHLSKSQLFLKSLIHSGSSYVILFSCLVVPFYIHKSVYKYIQKLPGTGRGVLLVFNEVEKSRSERASFGVHAEIKAFDYFYGLRLGTLPLGHSDSDNLSASLQTEVLCAAEALTIAKHTVATFKKIRTDENFHLL